MSLRSLAMSVVIAAASRPAAVVDHPRLAEARRDGLSDGARDEIVAAAGLGGDDAQWFERVGLGVGRQHCEHGEGGCRKGASVRHGIAARGALAMTTAAVIARSAATKQSRGARKRFATH